MDSPDEVAADLPMLSADERSQLLSGFNSTDALLPADKTLSQLFEAQAAARPQAACLTEGGKMLTYAEVKSFQLSDTDMFTLLKLSHLPCLFCLTDPHILWAFSYMEQQV